MAVIIERKDIQNILPKLKSVSLMEEAFIKYSSGKAIIPPVAELLFENPPGDVHIKYGYIKEDDFYCIKIASGFYENSKLGISSSQGMNLLFNQKTGELKAILLDGGDLTNIRTAAAGALVAKYFAPKNINAIGIIGTGIQAKLQLQYLQEHTPCKTVWVWGRSITAVKKYKEELNTDFDIHIAETTSELAKNCNLIITTTPSETPLLLTKDIQPGTHITAIGSDTENKRELEGEILKNADLIISDSIFQSKTRGEIFRAIKDGVILPENIIELGNAIQTPSLQRTNNQQITVADLTGLAVQDIMISTATYKNYING
ncbi:hypothetical protein [Tenacibaculum sp. 190524A02b]|uniref:Ornithine cyclodeaminase n=1 Tax=Tenacibaculum vairaonense TaxID=3137860 RepID=A0ABP1FDX5_9FLAO